MAKNIKKEEPKEIENIDALADKETLLNTRESELNIFAQQLAEKEDELKAREWALNKREQKEPLQPKTASPSLKVETPLEFTFGGEKYKFVENAPQLIRINAVAKTQKEIAQDEDLLLQLVGGKSNLIQKI